MSEDEPMFDIEKRRPLQVGDRVIVETIVGAKEAEVATAPKDGVVRVRWVTRNRYGREKLTSREHVDVGRVRHCDG